MTDLFCRCGGLDGDCPCENDAAEEDGLCDGCRCEHGCCMDHGSPKVGLTWDEQNVERGKDPKAWQDANLAAWLRRGECADRKADRKEVIAKT